MKQKEIEEIAERRFKTIDKLFPGIIKEFGADDIHKFRIEVKKLRAFLRLMNTEKDIEGPLLPKLLKTFYRDVGIIRNIQLHKHALFKYITDHAIEKPVEYFNILDTEEDHWKKETEELMQDNNFHNVKEKVLKELSGKLQKSSVKKFAKEKLDELKKQLENLIDDTAIHTTRKILKDILYTLNYVKDHADLPEAFSKDKLKSVAGQLGDFRDKCIQLEFLQPGYLDKIKNETEKTSLLKIQANLQQEKQSMSQQLHHDLNELHKQL